MASALSNTPSMLQKWVLPSATSICVRAVHPKKGFMPTWYVDDGIVNEASDVQLLNAWPLSTSRDEGKSIVSNDVHLEKAYSSIKVNPSLNIMFFRRLQL